MQLNQSSKWGLQLIDFPACVPISSTLVFIKLRSRSKEEAETGRNNEDGVLIGNEAINWWDGRGASSPWRNLA